VGGGLKFIIFMSVQVLTDEVTVSDKKIVTYNQ